MLACVTVFLYINRLRDRYPEFYTTDIFGNNGITNYQRGQVSTLPRIRKMKVNNQLVDDNSNESSFNDLNSNCNYMVLNPDDVE
jgi:hypothetical protein